MDQFLGNIDLLFEFPIVNLKIILDGVMIGALFALAAYGLALVWGTVDLPSYGDGSAAAHQHVAPRYIEDSPEEIGIPNLVTAILASYRGFDTLGEVVVVFGDVSYPSLGELTGHLQRRSGGGVEDELSLAPRRAALAGRRCCTPRRTG